jgi:sugar/nucleoside kinase (ribokinase family)
MEAKYLCINAQTNATNYGFNLITKYQSADLVVIDELEATLAAHDRNSSIEDVVRKLHSQGFYKKIIVTRGTKGAIGYDGKEFVHAPALTDKVTDSMGAGDAFLAVTSPFAAAGFSLGDLIRIGNAAGAVKVQIVGHRSSVTKEALSERLLGN